MSDMVHILIRFQNGRTFGAYVYAHACLDEFMALWQTIYHSVVWFDIAVMGQDDGQNYFTWNTGGHNA